MTDFALSAVWVDANGRSRQTIIKSLTGAAVIVATGVNLSTAKVNQQWQSLITSGGGAPIGGAYQAVADAAEYLFQTAAGSILRVTIPAAILSSFKADKITIDPASPNVAAFIAACIGNLSDGNGNAAVSYLGGRYIRGSRTDLDTP